VTDLVIYGAGGMAREVAQLVRDIVRAGSPINLLGFLDDDPMTHGSLLEGLPVLGDASYLASRAGEVDVVVGVGSPSLKRSLMCRANANARGFPILVHPNVVSSDSVRIGRGTIICAGSVLTVNIDLGDFSIINLSCTVSHDSTLEAFSTLGPGVNVSGNVRIGAGTDIGTGSTLIQGLTVGEWSIVGAGAAVTTNLPANCTAVGVPARVVKQRPAGWHLENP
jgi:sugar O-acyltransferase (sialic acid O-acetyltransferase NeuD family)